MNDPAKPDRPTNPYQAPEASATSNVSIDSAPGPYARLFVFIFTLLAAGCTFFCTCFGTGIIAVELTNSLDAVPPAVAVGILASVLVLLKTPKILMRWIHKRNSDAQHPSTSTTATARSGSED